MTRDKFLAFGEPDYTDLEIEAVTRVMRSGWVGMGPETLQFEKELAAFLDVPEVVSVNSCTSALFLSLLVEGVGPGDEVILPSLTWCADANVVLQLGAAPVFCDIDPHDLCVTPETVAAKLTPRTKAVIAVHYGGYGVDIAEIRRALPAKISIIEDAAHAFGALYPDRRKVGGSGNSVCFSFYANKNISTAEGGAVSLFDPQKAERLRALRMNGMTGDAWSRFTKPLDFFEDPLAERGYKMNFTDLQAAIGRAQLARYPKMANQRRMLAERYLKGFEALKVHVPFQDGVLSDAHARHLLVGLFDEKSIGMSRDHLLTELRHRNIGASIHYAPLHQMPLYASYDNGEPIENTDRLAKQIMTLPICSKMTMDDVDYVMEHMEQLLSLHILKESDEH